MINDPVLLNDWHVVARAKDVAGATYCRRDFCILCGGQPSVVYLQEDNPLRKFDD